MLPSPDSGRNAPESPSNYRLWVTGLVVAGGLVAVTTLIEGATRVGGIVPWPDGVDLDGWLVGVLVVALFFFAGALAGAWSAAWAIWGRKRAERRGDGRRGILRAIALNGFFGALVPVAFITLAQLSATGSSPLDGLVTVAASLVYCAAISAAMTWTASRPAP